MSFTLQIPSEQTALCFLTNSTFQHPIKDGDDCREDGMVYRDDKPVCKWFDRISNDTMNRGLRVWRPALQNIARIEAMYYRANQMRNKNWENNWPQFIAEFQQKHRAVFIPTDKDVCWEKYEYFLYEYSDYAEQGSIAEIGWKKGSPPDDADADLGQRYRQFIWIRQRQLGGRVSLLRAVLERAFERVLPQIALPATEEEYRIQKRKHALMSGKMFRIQINGRFYWYQFVVNSYGVYLWVPHYWPDQELETINLDENKILRNYYRG